MKRNRIHHLVVRAVLAAAMVSGTKSFADNPVVIGDPHVRFYAGIPLHAAGGAAVGAFCIVDSKPRSLSAAQLGMLKDIARLIEEELEPRAAAKAG